MANASVMGAVLALEIAFLGVVNPVAVGVINHVVEVGDALFFDEVAQNVDVAIGFGISSKDVVVGDDDDFVFVPDFGVLTELALEDADGAGAANVVGHEDVSFNPNILTGSDAGFSGRARKNFLSQRHKPLNLLDELS